MKRILIIATFLAASTSAWSEDVLIENVRIFDGVEATLTAGHVLVSDGLIAAISSESIDVDGATTVIDGGNRVLSPGFIDLHVHLTSHVPYNQIDAHGTVVGAVANNVARHFLDSGFTTVRDAGGTHPDQTGRPGISAEQSTTALLELKRRKIRGTKALKIY